MKKPSISRQVIENTMPTPFGIKIVGQKNAFFEKRTGEVVENKRKDYMCNLKRTGKRSGEVVGNT